MNVDNISVLIPCYNNENTIKDVVENCLHLVDDVYVVNDGSTDQSESYAKEAGAKILRSEKNLGVGNALQLGFTYLFEKEIKTIIILDADGAHDPFDISSLLETHFLKHNTLTIGNRFNHSVENIPDCKIMANKFANFLINRIAKLHLEDVACGFRIIDSSLFQLCKGTNDFGFLYEMIFLASKLGKIGNAPVKVRYDARNFWVTQRGEFLNLIDIVIKWCFDNDICIKLNLLRNKIIKWEKIIINFPDNNNQINQMYVHPIKSYGGYIFQKQNTYWLSEKNQSEIIIYF